MRFLCTINSQPSIQRIIGEFNDPTVEWEILNDFEEIRNSLAVKQYDLAIIDQKNEYFDQLVELLEHFQTPILIFRGTFEDIIESISQKIKFLKEQEKKEEEYIKSLTASRKKNERIIVKEVEKIVEVPIEVPVEVPVYRQISNRVICVVNLTSRAGSTFVALNLAREIAKYDTSVCLTEAPMGEPYLANLFALDEKPVKYSAIEEVYFNRRVESSLLPSLKGITFNVRIYRDQPYKWKTEHTLRLLYSTMNFNVSIFDIGYGLKQPGIIDLMKQANSILVVVDPFVLDILREQNRLKYFTSLREEQNLPIHFVFNRWNDGISENLFIESFGYEPITKIPAIDNYYVYKTLFSNRYKFLSDMKEVSQQLSDAFYPIIKNLVPKEVGKSKKIKLWPFR
ncbi:hypothetical protein GBL_3642 [Geobacillus kaustophilus GBlys]|uniref:CobQ/CobB/MinD/ParA nucleotide binding domain-containing protein n=1 Tax=Geobacillus kaustophilus GBlys TaxID=1337888 RepID=U2X8Y1_GEOKU|nr:hypothetical protein [Geobacillus kaustophilus]GAD15425.1 hypothetical protein GBL_3642 [Geobacillus kaustophilus GBlys]